MNRYSYHYFSQDSNQYNNNLAKLFAILMQFDYFDYNCNTNIRKFKFDEFVLDRIFFVAHI